MKTLKMFLIAMVLALAATPSRLDAQTQCGAGVSGCAITTTSAAQSAGPTNKFLTVSSATGITASTSGGFNVNTGSGGEQYCLVDRELEKVVSISSTTLTVIRASASTLATGHVSGARVICGPGGGNWNQAGSFGVFMTGNGAPPSGSCTRSKSTFLPIFQLANPVATGFEYDCLGGRWVQGTIPDGSAVQPALIKVCTVPIGSVAYGSFGTSTTASATVEYTANVFVPQTMLATGITNLNGSAVDTGSKKIVILHDMAGNLIANSATAGTAATGNDAFQAIPFTATLLVTGPAWYFVGLQDDTADANGIRTIATATFNNVIAAGPTSVFGTVGSITAPTTFTADVGPIACLY